MRGTNFKGPLPYIGEPEDMQGYTPMDSFVPTFQMSPQMAREAQQMYDNHVKKDMVENLRGKNKNSEIQAQLFEMGLYPSYATPQSVINGKMDERTKQAIKEAQLMGYKANTSKGTLDIDPARKLQRELFDKGFYGDKADVRAIVDGKIGPQTRKAIRKAEQQGFVIDQKAGTMTAKTKQPAPAAGNQGSPNAWDAVKDNPEFAQWLYDSGGKNAPVHRQLANLVNIGGNIGWGLMNPHGDVAFDWGEGTERQAVAATLNNLQRRGKGGIDDRSFNDFGAFGEDVTNSGAKFRNNKSQEPLTLFENMYSNPYHNIYGQSGGTYFSEDGFHAPYDNYTFNLVWDDNNNVIKNYKDGEGDASFLEAAARGIQQYKNTKRIQQSLETAGSMRGLDQKRHEDVKYVPQETLNEWAQEYQDYKETGETPVTIQDIQNWPVEKLRSLYSKISSLIGSKEQ